MACAHEVFVWDTNLKVVLTTTKAELFFLYASPIALRWLASMIFNLALAYDEYLEEKLGIIEGCSHVMSTLREMIVLSIHKSVSETGDPKFKNL